MAGAPLLGEPGRFGVLVDADGLSILAESGEAGGFSLEFLDLLQNKSAAIHFAADIVIYNKTSGAVETLRLADLDFTTKPSEDPANTRYFGGLDIPAAIRRGITGETSLSGAMIPDFGELVTNNIGGEHDRLRNFAADGRAIVIYAFGMDPGEKRWPRSRWQAIVTCTGASGADGGIRVATTSVHFALRDLRYLWADANLPTPRYRGTVTVGVFDGTAASSVSATLPTLPATTFEIFLRILDDNDLCDAQVLAFHGSAWGASTLDWYLQIGTTGLLTATIHRNSGSSVAISNTIDLRDGEKHHLALAIDAAVATLYVDRVAVGTATPPTYSANAAAVIGIGSLAFGPSNYFNGSVDEVRVWDVARTKVEIEQAAVQVIALGTAHVVECWRFDEGTGTTAFGDSGVDLTLTSATWGSSGEGGTDLAGQLRRVAYGECSNVEAIFADVQTNTYHFPLGPLQAVPTVYFRGLAKTLGVDYTLDLARGAVTPLPAVNGRVTGDILGYAGSGYHDTASEMAREVATGWNPLFGDCLELDGSTGKISIQSFEPQSADFTAELWIYPTGLDGTGPAIQRLVVKDDGSVNGWGLSINDVGRGNVRFYTRWTSTVSLDAPSRTIRPNRWQHVLASWNASTGTKELWVDGALVTSATGLTGTAAANSGALEAGSSVGGVSCFKGRMSEIRLWASARTAAEIADYQRREATGTEAGLARCLHLSDGDGAALVDATGTADSDVSGGYTWIAQTESVAVLPGSFEAFAELQPARIGHVFAGDATKLVALEEILAGVSGHLTFDRLGLLAAGRVDIARAPRLGSAAVAFDGVTAWGSVADSAYLEFQGYLGVEVWCRPDGTAREQCVVQKYGASGCGWAITVVAGAVRFRIRDASNSLYEASVAIEPGIWTHLSLQATDGVVDSAKAYINGELAAAWILPLGTLGANTNDIEVGGTAAGASMFLGVLDDLRLWWGKRLPRRVAATYKVELDGNEVEPVDGLVNFISVLVGYWPMNDGDGDEAADVNSSGYGTTVLELHGTTTWATAPEVTITADDIVSLEQIGALPEDGILEVAWSRNYTVMGPDQLDGAVTAERIAFLAQEARTKPVPAPEVQAAHLLASTAQIPGHFAIDSETVAEGQRLAGLSGLPLYLCRSKGMAFEVKMGQAFGVVYPRYDLETAGVFVALGSEDDWAHRETSIWAVRC